MFRKGGIYVSGVAGGYGYGGGFGYGIGGILVLFILLVIITRAFI
ncbi:sporulation protein YjcZ [Paenibacillus sp. 7541]|uniref:Sporulation protein YjcZ n=1 Tax=Paenibacillus campinasensis TaxID=66347 RepID=A0A268ERJ2_9BACL|nr:sporulation protein YjcZ [Paenibacillus campinasensis]PAD75745.1 sporulation protein YjcZ [Paenibacillus campinasensis]PAK54554.1 sporulation protein YjcZ [Paenibacillus sp. 7541]